MSTLNVIQSLCFCSLSLVISFQQDISGAIILTDVMLAGTIDNTKLHKMLKMKPNESYVSYAENRIKNGREFAKEMPFPIAEWWSVYYGPCPPIRKPVAKKFKYLNVGNDRGVIHAHKQIWENYVNEEKYIQNTTSSDLLVVFEDDCVTAVTNVTWSLENEFDDMSTDFLYLGWCHGDKAGKIPMCTHAYAVTRAGVKKMLPELDTCGTGLDGQFHQIIVKGVVTWRKAKLTSYANSLKPKFGTSGGIFKQVNTLASFNYHGWQRVENATTG